MVANIACLAQVVEHCDFIFSDYWDKVKENFRKHVGKKFFVLELRSAAGDLCQRDMIRRVNPETLIDDLNTGAQQLLEKVFELD